MCAFEQDPSDRAGDAAAEVATLMAQAVEVLTAAARAYAGPGPRPADRPQLESDPVSWAEFVTLALVGAAANVGSVDGVDGVLPERPWSWQSEGLRQLLTSVAGVRDVDLARFRTEPVVVDLYVDEILVEAGVADRFDAAELDLRRRSDRDGVPRVADEHQGSEYEVAAARLSPATTAQQSSGQALDRLQDELEARRLRVWDAYGQALAQAVRAQAASIPGLRVPVLVTVDVETFRRDRSTRIASPLAEHLRLAAIDATPLPDVDRGAN